MIHQRFRLLTTVLVSAASLSGVAYLVHRRCGRRVLNSKEQLIVQQILSDFSLDNVAHYLKSSSTSRRLISIHVLNNLSPNSQDIVTLVDSHVVSDLLSAFPPSPQCSTFSFYPESCIFFFGHATSCNHNDFQGLS
ncbi:hypothetical protein GEMRC1_002307 [Eukaryota sp. GEM-RC1]